MEESTKEELLQALAKARAQLDKERAVREDADAELESERATVEILLEKLDTLELTNRAAAEEHGGREAKLRFELAAAHRLVQDERSVRLQVRRCMVAL